LPAIPGTRFVLVGISHKAMSEGGRTPLQGFAPAGLRDLRVWLGPPNQLGCRLDLPQLGSRALEPSRPQENTGSTQTAAPPMDVIRTISAACSLVSDKGSSRPESCGLVPFNPPGLSLLGLLNCSSSLQPDSNQGCSTRPGPRDLARRTGSPDICLA
jgi:hypothetical protein